MVHFRESAFALLHTRDNQNTRKEKEKEERNKLGYQEAVACGMVFQKGVQACNEERMV